MKYIWYLPKNIFVLVFPLRGKHNFFLSHFSDTFASLSALSGNNIVCKQGLHLENGLQCHLNE